MDFNRLRCVRFDNKTLADSVREKCAIEFPMHYFTIECIVYYEDGDNIEVLGYFLIKEKQITNSKYFESFTSNCKNIGGIDTNSLLEKKAYQIIEWYLKDEFNDKQILYIVFEQITCMIGELNDTVVLWRDGRDEFEFYPITNDKYMFKSESASMYFTERFIQ